MSRESVPSVSDVRVFVVDDHEIVRMGLRNLIGAESGMRIVGEASGYAAALAGLATYDADVAVLDIRLPDGSGIDLCRELRSARSDLRCLILTSSADERAMLAAVEAGASGYLVKDVGSTAIVEAVRRIGNGGSSFDNRAVRVMMAALRSENEGPSADHLTESERKLLELLGHGLTNRQISQQLFLSENTVKNYVSRLLIKLGLESRTRAALFASQLPWTTAGDGGYR